jgi:hypothetical protein
MYAGVITSALVERQTRQLYHEATAVIAEADRWVDRWRKAKARTFIRAARYKAAIVTELYRAHPAPLDRRHLCDALGRVRLPISRQSLSEHIETLIAAGVVMEHGREYVRPQAGGFAPMTYALTPAFLDSAVPNPAPGV